MSKRSNRDKGIIPFLRWLAAEKVVLPDFPIDITLRFLPEPGEF